MYVYYIGLPVLMMAAVVDSSVMVEVRYLNGQPSLLLMLVMSWTLLNDLPEALPWAVMGGIFADILSVSLIGTSSIALALAVIAVGSLFGQVSRRNLIAPPLAIVLGTVIFQVVWLTLVVITTPRTFPLGEALLSWTLPSIVFNMVGVLVVFRMMGAVVEFFRPPASSL